MFFLEMGDGPWMLLAEIALSVAVILGIMFVARLANSGSSKPPVRPHSGSLPGQHRLDPTPRDQSTTGTESSDSPDQSEIAEVPR